MPIELGYEEILEQLATCPISYLPALFIRVSEFVYERGVLNPGGASKLVAKVEAKLGKTAPDEQKPSDQLKAIVGDLHWMARRYADGRSTYATSLFNERTREALALGVILNPTADGTIWASDGSGPAFDGLTPEERANPMMVLVDGKPESLAERDARMKNAGAAEAWDIVAARSRLVDDASGEKYAVAEAARLRGGG